MSTSVDTWHALAVNRMAIVVHPSTPRPITLHRRVRPVRHQAPQRVARNYFFIRGFAPRMVGTPQYLTRLRDGVDLPITTPPRITAIALFLVCANTRD